MTDLCVSAELRLPTDAVTQTFAFLAMRGRGKALSVTTPIPTPDGWSTMGALRAGDMVYDEHGRPCRVVAAHPVRTDRPCYRVQFSDGAEIVADAEHLWVTEDRNARANGHLRGEQVWFRAQRRSTQQIAETLWTPGTRGDRNHSIPTSGPLVAPEVDLPIDPYLFGYWLGDGTTTTGVITTVDLEVLSHFRDAGWKVGEGYLYSEGRVRQYRIHEGPDGQVFTATLRSLGVLGNKHVPDIYLRASISQRLALLRGLMDSDGSSECGRAKFYSTSEALAGAVHELVVSLGWQARRSKKAAMLNGIDHGVCHVISFRPDQSPFLLRRKSEGINLSARQATRHRRRMIVAVEPIESVSVRCIEVDSESHLFLAGRDMVPTHNTYAASVLAEEMIEAGLPVVIVDPLGVWWGLRSSADGESPGLPVVIFGGEHADVPLEPTAGRLIADIEQVVKSRPGISLPKPSPALTPRRTPGLASDTRETMPMPRRQRSASEPGAGITLGKAQRSILTALAQHGVLDKDRLALFAGYTSGGGSFNNALGSLRTAEYITRGGWIEVTEAGLEALGEHEPLPTGQALVEHHSRNLTKAAREILDVLVRWYPGELSKEEIAQETPTQYASGGGSFNNALGRLRTLGLIVTKDGRNRVVAELGEG